jgi:hypothetical protein
MKWSRLLLPNWGGWCGILYGGNLFHHVKSMFFWNRFPPQNVHDLCCQIGDFAVVKSRTLTLIIYGLLRDGIPIPTIGTPSTYVCMLGRQLHLRLDAMSVSDILSFVSRPKCNLEKHLTMILVDIDKKKCV